MNNALTKWASIKKDLNNPASCNNYDHYIREFNKGKSFEYSE
jgi:hypothetical protein